MAHLRFGDIAFRRYPSSRACKLSCGSGQQWDLRSPQRSHLSRRAMSKSGVNAGRSFNSTPFDGRHDQVVTARVAPQPEPVAQRLDRQRSNKTPSVVLRERVPGHAG